MADRSGQSRLFEQHPREVLILTELRIDALDDDESFEAPDALL
jgi:hypothetical protein